MTPLAWAAVVSLLVFLAVLQVVGQRGLAGLGVQPGRAVIAIRILNFAAVLGVLVYAFWRVTSG